MGCRQAGGGGAGREVAGEGWRSEAQGGFVWHFIMCAACQELGPEQVGGQCGSLVQADTLGTAAVGWEEAGWVAGLACRRDRAAKKATKRHG